MTAPFSTLLMAALLTGSIVTRAADAPSELPAALRPPIPPSPIEEFRRWLKMSDDDRNQVIATYSPAKQEILKRKIQAYAAMPEAERDARLHALELRWYLEPLMVRASAERGKYLEMIPPRLHREINARLEHWDGLGDGIRQEILADQTKQKMVTTYFIHSGRAPRLPVVMPPHPAEIEANLQRWQKANAEKRERMTEHLATFFQLPAEEQRKAMGALLHGEHESMQRTLDAFSRLSPADRRACVASFQKFATMDPKERASFLRNAARWQQLTPEERQTWRELVNKIPPMPVVEPPLPTTGSRQGANATARRMASTASGLKALN